MLTLQLHRPRIELRPYVRTFVQRQTAVAPPSRLLKLVRAGLPSCGGDEDLTTATHLLMDSQPF